MDKKTKPFTGRIKDIVSRHLETVSIETPVEIQGFLR